MKCIEQNPCVHEYEEKCDNVELFEDYGEILMEPGDICISTCAGWDEVLDVLVRHARGYMPDDQWDTKAVINALSEHA